MAPRLHECRSPNIIPLLKRDLVRQHLVVEPWHRQRIGDAHVVVYDMSDRLQGGCDDTGASGGSGDEVERVIDEFDDSEGCAGNGAFVGADVV